MNALCESFGYMDAELVDKDGYVFLSTEKGGQGIEPLARSNIAKVIETGKPLLSDIHEAPDVGVSHLGLYVPIAGHNDSGALLSPSCVLLLNIDPSLDLWPYIESRPVESKTGESMLVKREGDKILYLNPLRFGKAKPLSIKLPFNTRNLPASMAMQGKEGIVTGVDYRGVKVLAALKRVPFSDWYLVSKVDIDEVVAPMQGKMKTDALMLTIILFLLTSMLYAWWKRHQVRFLQKELDFQTDLLRKTQALQESEERFKKLFDNAPDAHIMVNGEGRVVLTNEQTEKLFGYCREELLDMTVEDLVPSRYSRHAALRQGFSQNPYTRPMGKGVELFARRKDGNELPVEIMLCPVKFADDRQTLVIIRDITERKRMEDALRESEERYKAVVENQTEMIGRCGLDTTLLFANQSFLSFFGVSFNDCIGSRWIDSLPPNQREQALKGIRSVTRENMVSVSEIKAVMPDGNTNYVEWIISGIFDEAGNIVEHQCVGRDITERKLAEDALRESDERYRAIVETQTELVSRFKPDTTLVFANNALCRYYGMRLDDIIGRRWIELIPEDFRDPILNDLDKITYDNPAVQTETLQPVQGELKWQSWIRTGIFDGDRRLVEIQGVGRDITKRKQAEEKLKRAQRETELILEAAGEGIYGLDTEGKVTFINREAARILGHEREEILGQLGRVVIHHTRPDGAPYRREECPIYAALKDGIARGVSEGTFWRKDGASIPVEFISTPVFGDGGQSSGAVVVFRDISARKSAQAENLKLQEQLIQAQKMESIGRLAGGVAHDMNNMLTIILGYSELLKSSLKDTPQDDLDQLHEIYEAGQRAKGIVAQLLAFSRKQVINVHVLNPNDVILSFEKMLGRLIGEDIELTTILDPQIGLIKADASQLEQVLLNLAVNARDAMPRGGRLTIETSNVLLDEEYAKTHANVQSGQHVLLTVSDTGVGMDSETQMKVFEPFFTTKEVGAGTGLGLSTVYGIIKQHDGHIGVYSEPGCGTTFKLYIPRAIEESEMESPPAQIAASTGSERILLVEDDESIRNMAMHILTKAGYEVHAAGRLSDALRKASEIGVIDLLLTDVVMPEASGRDVQRALSELQPGIKVLFMSGYTDNVIVHHGVLEEGIHLLQKPFTSEGLLKRVREMLDA